jgi:hypothetical protein
MKKIPEKLGRYSDYESIKALLHDAVYDSLSKSDFMEKWEKMIEDFELQDNEWLKGIFDERNRWVPVYVRDTFWAGMSTTQRSESMNSCSKVDQIVKKVARKRTQKSSQKSENCQAQKKVILRCVLLE